MLGRDMKYKTGTILLVVIIGLVVALVATKKQAANLHIQNTAALLELSNQLETANLNYNGLDQTNLMLTNDLAAMSQTIMEASNQLAETSGRLTLIKNEVVSNQARITRLNGLVGSLEPQNEELNERAMSLSNSLVALNAEIFGLRHQLATTGTNDTFLAAELQKQMEQKGELEHQFNDLDEVTTRYNYLALFGFY
jgi:chromosome segregation ATPase